MKIELDLDEAIIVAVVLCIVAALLASANITGCAKEAEQQHREQSK